MSSCAVAPSQIRTCIRRIPHTSAMGKDESKKAEKKAKRAAEAAAAALAAPADGAAAAVAAPEEVKEKKKKEKKEKKADAAGDVTMDAAEDAEDAVEKGEVPPEAISAIAREYSGANGAAIGGRRKHKHRCAGRLPRTWSLLAFPLSLASLHTPPLLR